MLTSDLESDTVLSTRMDVILLNTYRNHGKEE